jgi:hypothetical protein
MLMVVDHRRTTTVASSSRPLPISLPLLLLRIYRDDGGVRGLYRGCDLQLLHVLLKSALMMMVRERMSEIGRRFLDSYAGGGRGGVE